MDDASNREGEAVRRVAHPLTFGGVAAFATRSWWWLLLCAAVVASVTAAVSFFLFLRAWGPALGTAAYHFPSKVTFQQGTLNWEGPETLILADNTFLALLLRAGADPVGNQTADLQMEFGHKSLILSSLLGYIELDYPLGQPVSLGREDAIPRWRTWRPYVGGGLAATGFLFAFLVWALLSLVVCPFLRLYAACLGRGISAAAAIRLGWGALLPGALVLNASILLYALKQFSLVEMLLAVGVHLVVDLLYLLISPWRLPKQETGPSPSSIPNNSLKDNPFSNSPPAEGPTAKSENPFSS